MVLTGTEVKALRIGKANIGDSYVRIKRNEAFVYKMHIGPYPYAAFGNHEPERIRKLLLHKREIKRLIGKIQEKGYTLIPTKLYFKDHVVKVEIALAKGKKLHDKRQAIKKRDEKRDLERTMKRYKR
jgi:SsrA-binding protein